MRAQCTHLHLPRSCPGEWCRKRFQLQVGLLQAEPVPKSTAPANPHRHRLRGAIVLLPCGLNPCGIVAGSSDHSAAKSSPAQDVLPIRCEIGLADCTWKCHGQDVQADYSEQGVAEGLSSQHRFRVVSDFTVQLDNEAATAQSTALACDEAAELYASSTSYVSEEGHLPDCRGRPPSEPLLLQPMCLSSAADRPCAPTMQYRPKASPKCTTVPAHLDMLAYIPPNTPASNCQALLRKGVQRYITSMLHTLQLWASGTGGTPPGLSCCHYTVPPHATPITAIYPVHAPSCTADEEAKAPLRNWRQALHEAALVPADAPRFRLGNALYQGGAGSADAAPSTVLQDVHLTLPPSGVVGGTKYLISGSYGYHHYMQDGINDNGWGCAYRSLQTIWSWFRMQSFTGAPIPSHRDIQMALAKLGDKPASFVGSKEWVGAVELGMVLQELLGVEYRIITSRKGSDVPSKAADLAEHFKRQGTPVMVGGGVLAYTLLGIDWNAETGDVAFLILDPHYTGHDDLAKVKAGSWVAWKRLGEKAAAGGALFVPNAFYNFMCPQRPQGV